MHAWALAVVLAASPRFHPGPPGIVLDGPLAPASPRAAGFLQHELGLRTDTSWSGRRIELLHGGWLLILREHHRGLPVAGARLALRVGPDGRLRQVVGSGLSRDFELGRVSETKGATLWWPTERGLVPARSEDSPLRWHAGAPVQEQRWVDARTGRVLAREPAIDEILVPIRGWPESSLATPDLVDYDVELADLDPIVLEDGVFRVYQCHWDDQAKGCAPIFDPAAEVPTDLYMDPPAYDDVEGNAAQDDPHAALQFMQQASRFETKLAQWGWDSYPWDVLDCSWQETPDPADCRVHVYVNVLAQDDQGVYPYAGGFYRATGKIFLGQGYNADTAYDGDIVVHEIGHHVTHSFGTPEPSGMVDDGARLYTDINAVNEASSDVFAWLMGTNDRIYDYFSALEPGTYIGPRIRDVSIPFQCPQNVVGEVHMDGRIWVSAVIDGEKALVDAGLADADAFAQMYLGALAAIRQIPRDQLEQMPEMRAILLDEVELSFGAQARTLLEDIFDERRIGVCDYVIDLRQEPSLQGDVDPNDVLDTRFMVFRSHKPWEDPTVIDEQPFAPPVQHRITLGADEGGVELRYWPNLWRPDHPVDEVALTVAALVREGDQRVGFSRDPETGSVTNDAQLRFLSQPDGDEARLVIDGLTPGATYTIALVSLTPVDGDALMMEDMRWRTLPAPSGDETGDSSGTSTGAGEESGTAGTSADGAGCGCATPHGFAPGWPWLALLPLARRRRSCTIREHARAHLRRPVPDRVDPGHHRLP